MKINTHLTLRAILSLIALLAIFHLPTFVSNALSNPTHNSDKFSCNLPKYITAQSCTENGGAWNPSRKWPGGWGIIGGEYGEFGCKTCHVRKPANGNIKRIRSTIVTYNSSFPGEAVEAKQLSPGVSSDFGDDTVAHSDSERVCEVCHSKTLYHRYDTSGQSNLDHYNSTDCIGCHRHNAGFRPDCSSCHGNSTTLEAWPDGDISNNIDATYAWTDDEPGSHAVHVRAIGTGSSSCFSCHPGNPPVVHYLDSLHVTGVEQAEVTRMDTDNDSAADYWEYLDGPTAVSGTPVYFKNTAGLGDPDAYYRFDNSLYKSTCYNIDCHGGAKLKWGETNGCIACHSDPQGNRVAVVGQFSANSHHVQGPTLTSAHCYQCHWEANSDGTINPDYHGGVFRPGSEVDLVIYGNGSRPTNYTEDTSVIRYASDGSRGEIESLNAHCLGCHSEQNSLTQPFQGDNNTPQHYAWDKNDGSNPDEYPYLNLLVDEDGTSIDSRYSQTTSTTWGKYAGVANAAKKDLQKAYSAHGNAGTNAGGWERTTGVDGVITNSRENQGPGTNSVACFDCHNSHGSSVAGTTTSYSSETINGGLLKDTVEGYGGYGVSYQPVSGGSALEKDQRNAGASLCMDCHLTADGGDTLPWGYQETYGASKKIVGYYDSPYFSQGPSGPKIRNPFMAANNNKGGHFGASSPLYNSADHSIGGLCTPCHDPHGVSPGLSSNQKYGIPLLKGTWLTSPYKEDVPPLSNNTQRVQGSRNDRYIYIDGTTFGSHISQLVTGIGETEDQFGGLCLRCHPKSSLTDGVTHTWKGKDRIHEAVKGWDSSGVTKHNFSCSKCHTSHIGSTLPRLMVTNCMDPRHKGRVVNEPSPRIADLGIWFDDDLMYGKCGEGRIPGSRTECKSGWHPENKTFACHEAENGYADQGTDQSWNIVTPWAPSFYVKPVPYVTNATKSAAYPGKVKFYVKWGTNLTSDRAVDYGLTPDYGQTIEYTTTATNHVILLDGLENHNTYYYQVRSNTAGGDSLTFGKEADLSYYISVPPNPVSLNLQPSQVCTGSSINVTLSWLETQDVDGGPIEYYVEVDNTTSFASPAKVSSGWITANSATLGPLACDDTWYWQVKARDAGHVEAETNWSSRGSFDVGPEPSKPATPTLVNKLPTVCGSNCPATLVSNTVANPYPLLYGEVEYYFEVDDTLAFNSPGKVIRDWLPSRVASITGLDGDKTWYWHAKARYANYPEQALESFWSIPDPFEIIYPLPSTPTALFTQDVVYANSATLIWSPSTAEDSGPVEYDVRVDDDSDFVSVDYNSSGLAGTNSLTEALGVGTWYWQVMARDVNHPSAESGWSNTGEFRVYATAPASKTITFTWPDVPFGSITIDGVPYGGPAGSVDVEITKNTFTAEIVGAPGQSGGGEFDPVWNYYAGQAAGGAPGNIAATFTPNDGNSFTVKAGVRPPYTSTGGSGGGASYVAKDADTIMYAAAGGGGGGGEATYLDGEELPDGEIITWKARGSNGFPGESFGEATGGTGGAGSTSTSGAGVAGSTGGNGDSIFTDYLGVTGTTIIGDTTTPRVTITTRYPGSTVPTLNWTDESNYSSDGVDPESGVQLSDFTFRVNYTDSDDDSPWPIEVWIDLNDNGSYQAGEKFIMNEVDSADTDYTNGKLYTYSKALAYTGDGILTYRFHASDGGSPATGVPTADQTITVFNTSPNVPAIISPTDGSANVPQPVVLVASDFDDPDTNDTHQASQWLISSVSGAEFNNNLLYNSGTFAPETLHRPDVSVTQGETYYWMVRYQDNHGAWSPYSPETSFTLIDNAPPNTPVNVTPAHATEGVFRQVRLEASDFSDADGDSHQGSLWQVSTRSGESFVDGRFYNSGAVAGTTSYNVAVTLDQNTVYFWRVGYQDDKNQWSPFSADTRFKTTNLVSYWSLDDGAGTEAADTLEANIGALKTGASWNTSSAFSGAAAIDFDGSVGDLGASYNQGMTWTYANGLPANNFTIEAMVRTSDTHEIDTESASSTTGTLGQKYLFGAQHRGADGGAGISVATNGISVYEHGASYMPPLAVYANDIGTGWNHIVVTYTNKQPRIYLNGDLVHTGLISTKPNVYAPVQLGGGSYGFFTGSVDEVAIYGQPLSKAEVLKRCIEVGQCSDGDVDSDGVSDSTDNCLFEPNSDQADFDNDGIGNACEYLSYWKFDEGTGSTAQDETIHNNDGQLIGGATWTTGKVGSSIDFDGATGYVRIPDTPLHHFGTGSFTIETWINARSFTSTDDPNIVRWFSKSAWCSTWSTDPSCVWFVGQVNSTGHPQFSGRGYGDSSGFGITAPGTISLDTWHHIAYVIDRSVTPAKGFIYIDGVNQSGSGVEFAQLTGELNIPAQITLGGGHADLPGNLDQTAIYDSALSAAEILDHYQNP